MIDWNIKTALPINVIKYMEGTVQYVLVTDS